MLHKISILAVLGFATLLWVAPARADLIHDWDDDSTPHYSHDVRLDENLKVNGSFSTFDRDVFKGEKSDFKPGYDFRSGGVPKTAEWIWWLDHSDKKDFGTDIVVTAPEPASFFLLGSGILALGACRRRSNHSAPNA